MSDGVIYVLSIEDTQSDAWLIEELLADAPRLGWDIPRFEVTHATSVDAGLQHLDENRVDVILTDLDLPDSRAERTFAQIQARAPAVPIVVLTGREDKELARQTVRTGAEDYLFKREMNASLLAHALIYAIERKEARRALQEAHDTLEQRVAARTEALEQANEELRAEIEERKRAEAQREDALQAMRESERRYRSLVEQSLQGIVIAQDDPVRLIFVNKPMGQICGYPPEELEQFTPEQLAALIHPEDRATFFQNFRDRLQGKDIPPRHEYRILHKDGEVRRVEIYSSRIEYAGEPATQTVFLDITRHQRMASQQEDTLAALQASQERFHVLFNNMKDGVFVHRILPSNQPGPFELVNEAACAMTGYTREELSTMTPWDLDDPETSSAYIPEAMQRLHEDGHAVFEAIQMGKNGRKIPVEVSASVVTLEGKPTIISVIRDITERKHMESERRMAIEALQESEKHLAMILEGAELGTWDWDVQTGHVVFNARWAAMLGYTLDEIEPDVSEWEKFVHPDDMPTVRETLNAHLEGRTPIYRSEYRMRTRSGGWTWILDVGRVLVRDEAGRPIRAAGIHQDITERKRAEAQLAQYAAELKRSNEELEQFGYVISHDLREPLRMVKSYLDLLARRYRGALDAKAHQYIDYAVDGAERMQAMIQALLDLSRVETQGRGFAPTDTESIVHRTRQALARVIEETGAEITHDPLPTVMADEAQLAQVFQNLIANALKFRREGVPPRVRIAAVLSPPANSPHRREEPPLERGIKGRRDAGGEWRFSVTDNGIGVPPDQTDRLFQIFQRLHTKNEYEGLGIGLALCKRIVARHGGRIWVESEPGAGATFTFTLPVRQGERNGPS